METKNNKPINTYKAGLLSLAVWENKLEDENKNYSFTFQRNFKNEKDDTWKKTQSLRLNDLPKLKVLIEEAYKNFIMKK